MAPPPNAMSALSESIWRTSAVCEAPRAARIAISRCRVVARVSNRLAMFAHAISSTNPTAPSMTRKVGRKSSGLAPPNNSRRNGARDALTPALDVGYSRSSRRLTPARCAFAWASVTPSRRRTKAWTQLSPRPSLGSKRNAVQPDLPAHHMGIRREVTPPDGVAQDDDVIDVIMARGRFFREKRSPKRGVDTEEIESPDADFIAFRMLRVLGRAQIGRPMCDKCGALKHVRIGCPIEDTRRVDVDLPGVRGAEMLHDGGEALRGRERQRAIEQRAQNGEDGGVGADADGEREDRHRGEAGALGELAQREAEVVHRESGIRDRVSGAYRGERPAVESCRTL